MNAKVIIPDVAFVINGDLIELEQSIGVGEIASLTIHRCHIDVLIAHLGLPVLQGTAAELFRRLEVVRDSLATAVDAYVNGSDILEHAGGALEVLEKLKTALTLANEFVADFDQPEEASHG